MVIGTHRVLTITRVKVMNTSSHHISVCHEGT